MKAAAEVIERSVASLKLYARNARTHSRKQIKQIASSIERFGLVNPVLIGDDGDIIAGHGRIEAAKQLGLKTVPTLALYHLSETEKRAYVLADNKLALNAGWDREILAIELQGLVDLDFDVELTGFSLAEIDFVPDEAGEADPDAQDAVQTVKQHASNRLPVLIKLLLAVFQSTRRHFHQTLIKPPAAVADDITDFVRSRRFRVLRIGQQTL